MKPTKQEAVGERRKVRLYVRKLKSGGWGVYSTVVNVHGFYKTEAEARRAARGGRA